MFHPHRLLLVAALAIPLPALADQGYIYKFFGPSGSGKTTTILVLGGSERPRRLVLNKGEDGAVHADFDARNIYVVNEKDKEIMDMAAISASMKKSGMMPVKGNSQIQQQLSAQEEMIYKQLEAALASIPESQREIARKAMEKQFGLKPKPDPANDRNTDGLVDTGQTMHQNNIDSRLFEYSRNGRLLSEIWVADSDSILGGADFLASLKLLQELFDEIMGNMVNSGKDGPISGMFLSGITRIDGVPVAVTSFSGGKKEEYVLESFNAFDANPDSFAPPIAYEIRSTIGLN